MNHKIPIIKRDTSLFKRLLPIVLIGMDGVLDKKSQLYFRLLSRLTDKAFDEYCEAREFIQAEIKTNDKLSYRFGIISHLENCLNAINRVIKVFDVLLNGKYKKENEIKRIIKQECNLLKFSCPKTIQKIKAHSVSAIRNRVEHIEEDIYLNNFNGQLFLDIDSNYKNLCINNKCLSLSDLAKTIEDYHHFVLEICNNLPNRMEKGIYYWDKK